MWPRNPRPSHQTQTDRDGGADRSAYSASTFLEDGSHYLAWLIEDYQRRLDKDALTKKERLVMETRLNAALAIHIRMSKASKVIVDPLLKMKADQ